MKNSSAAGDFRNDPDQRKSFLKKVEETNNVNPQAVKPSMTEQLIAPPSYIWDKIEQVLDQQQSRRQDGSEIISTSFAKPAQAKKKKYIAAVAGITVIAGFLWMIL